MWPLTPGEAGNELARGSESGERARWIPRKALDLFGPLLRFAEYGMFCAPLRF